MPKGEDLNYESLNNFSYCEIYRSLIIGLGSKVNLIHIGNENDFFNMLTKID